MVLRGIFAGVVILGVAASFAGCSDEPAGLDGGTSPTSTATTPPTNTTPTSTPDSSTPTPDSSTPTPDGSTPDSATPDASTADASDGATAPTFTMVWNGILSQRCGAAGECHNTAGGRGGLIFNSDKATAYTNLTTGANTQACAGTTKRVVAGNAAMSKLFAKISGTTCGNQMPLNMTALSPAQINTIRDWINAGALNN